MVLKMVLKHYFQEMFLLFRILYVPVVALEFRTPKYIKLAHLFYSVCSFVFVKGVLGSGRVEQCVLNLGTRRS